MKHLRKLPCLLLALALVLTLIPATAHAAATSGKCGDNVTWKLSSTGTLTISGTGPMYDYEYNPGAPWMGEAVKKAVIGSGVTYIGQFAFTGCPSLTGVEIADTVTEIGIYAFYETYGVTEFKFPKNLTKIGAWSFARSGVREINLPAGLKEIGDCAFSYCGYAGSVTIPNSVTVFGENVFGNCASLTSAVIPESITSLRGTFYGCNELTSVSLPDTLTRVGDFTFCFCNKLASITIPASVKSDGKYAFGNSEKLKQIYFSGNAPTFEEDSFDSTTTTAYYPAGNSTWTSGVRQGYGGTMTWKPLAVITQQPQNAAVKAGETAKFGLRHTGSGVTYQWQYRTSASGAWANSGAEGAKTSLLKISATAARDGYQYRCVITHNGVKVYSDAATLTVKPVITTQPADKAVKVGGTAKFTVKAAGDGLTYRWQYRTSPTGSWKNSGATGHNTATLSIVSAVSRNGYQYRCVVEDEHGNKAISTGATLTVKPAITAQPASKTAASGTTVKFTVKAAGVGITYRWQYRTSSTGSWKNSGATGHDTATLTISAAASRNGYQYRCVIVDESGSKVISTAATLTVK